MIATALGLATAWVWATTSLLAKAQSAQVHPLSFNAIRMATGALLFLALVPFFGGWAALEHLSVAARFALAGSTMIGGVIGDSLYFWSMTRIGASRTLPISGIYPVFTWGLAVPLLGEPITPNAMIGTLLVLISLYLLAPPPDPGHAVPTETSRGAWSEASGVLAAIGAAAVWAVSTTMLKFGMQEAANVVVVNALRLPLGALFMVIIAQSHGRGRLWRDYRSHWSGLTALGLYSMGLGAILWPLAVDYAGAARAALLNTLSPLIAVPLAAIFLHERVTRRVAGGACLSVLGIFMIL